MENLYKIIHHQDLWKPATSQAVKPSPEGTRKQGGRVPDSFGLAPSRFAC